MSKIRVVVTGLGALTPVGNNVDSSWKNILAGISGVTSINHFDSSDYASQIYAGVKNFDVLNFLSPKECKQSSTFIHYGLVAAAEAINDSGLEITDENREQIGVYVGSGIGSLGLIQENYSKLLERGPRKVSPYFIPATIINMVSGNIAIKYKLLGPSFSIVSACTTGTHNIGEAFHSISSGRVKVIVAGGAEHASVELGFAGFSALKALSTRNNEPERASRPWDKDRDGFVLGDGAGVLVLEELEHAKARGAKIYAEIVGYGASSDGYHMTAPDPEGMGAAISMKKALKDAKLNPSDVDYINAHGTSTPLGDLAESNSIKKLFGDHAYNLAVSSTKSMTGHLLGAAGSVEAIFSILAIKDSVAPPTINLDNPSEGCDLNYVAHTAQERNIEVALSNSFGFGGTNGTLIFKKFKD